MNRDAEGLNKWILAERINPELPEKWRHDKRHHFKIIQDFQNYFKLVDTLVQKGNFGITEISKLIQDLKMRLFW